MATKIISKMTDRVRNERDDSDVTFFNSLLLFGELIIKLTANALIAAIADDKERMRYRIVHKLVRADGIGEWASAISEAATGPASSFLDEEAVADRNQITQRTAGDSWIIDAIHKLNDVVTKLDIRNERPPTKPNLLKWFDDFAMLRNKTRGHGAKLPVELSKVAPLLFDSISLLADHIPFFARPWVHLYRNLSGKYRVTRISANENGFEELKRSSESAFDNGVYIAYSQYRMVQLLYTDQDLSDCFFPNGNFSDRQFELLSYITGDTRPQPSSLFLPPVEELPLSETGGQTQLDIIGKTLHNLPGRPNNYIKRPQLEKQLVEQLLLNDRHPIVTLSGPGGVGKTSVALDVVHDIIEAENCPFFAILWFSSRDIDLLPHGAKSVKPSGVNIDDFASQLVTMLDPNEARDKKKFNARQFMAQQLSEAPNGATLYVVDNFETVTSPKEAFTWFDEYIRPSNKILITTRIRDAFNADLEVKVKGMNDDECNQLISTVAATLSISNLVTEEYREQIIKESGGHPYVIKILLGEVAKHRKLVKIERVIASQDKILDALFERTYQRISPTAKRVFLTLCSWRSAVLELALEAVLVRPTNQERIDVKGSLDELIRYSLVEEHEDNGEKILEVPLAANIFGRRKLETSEWRASVERDSALLQLFGPRSKSDGAAEKQIRHFFSTAAQTVSSRKQALIEVKPLLEFLALRFPEGWMALANLLLETSPEDHEQIKDCYQRYLETVPEDADQWFAFAEWCERDTDAMGELKALAGLANSMRATIYQLSSGANKLNRLFKNSSLATQIERDDRLAIVKQYVAGLEESLDILSATDLSRLAWLYLRLSNEHRALELTYQGLDIDPQNSYCQSLKNRLEGNKY